MSDKNERCYEILKTEALLIKRNKEVQELIKLILTTLGKLMKNIFQIIVNIIDVDGDDFPEEGTETFSEILWEVRTTRTLIIQFLMAYRKCYPINEAI